MPSTATDRLSGASASVAVKAPCRVATTANITLSGTPTIDDVDVAAGDRVLVKNQSAASQNGIWVAGASAWSRARDFDGSRDVVTGSLVPVNEGTLGAGFLFKVTTANPIAIGTSNLAFQASTFTDLSVSAFWQGILGGLRVPLAPAKGADIASASTLVLGMDGGYFDVTGSTGPITAITVAAGTLFMLQFDATPTLTHHATNLNLPGGANIVAAAGDRLVAFATGANTVHVLAYVKANGSPVAFVGAPYDVAFAAGFDFQMVKENIEVATYGELVMTRAGSFTGESGYIDTAPTGTVAIVDILKNGTTVYATKPQFTISANTLTAGTLKTDGTEDFIAGDRIAFKVTQIGSTEPGEGLRFTARGTLG